MNDKIEAGCGLGMIAGLIIGLILEPILKTSGGAPAYGALIGLVLGGGAAAVLRGAKQPQ